jgi:zona occludens toxin (predicted ATPase)
MSVTLYTGTPGSGKSYHVISDVMYYLSMGKPVIANFPLNFFSIKNERKREKYQSLFHYVTNNQITVEFLVDFSKEYFRDKKIRGSQILLVIDEAQLMFNSREYAKPDRMKFVSFFSQHRKLGYEVILVAQYDRMLDRQIRAVVEYEKLHRKLNNYRWFWILPFTVFTVTTFWYGIRERTGQVDVIIYNPFKARLYNTFALFEGVGG